MFKGEVPIVMVLVRPWTSVARRLVGVVNVSWKRPSPCVRMPLQYWRTVDTPNNGWHPEVAGATRMMRPQESAHYGYVPYGAHDRRGETYAGDLVPGLPCGWGMLRGRRRCFGQRRRLYETTCRKGSRVLSTPMSFTDTCRATTATAIGIPSLRGTRQTPKPRLAASDENDPNERCRVSHPPCYPLLVAGAAAD